MRFMIIVKSCAEFEAEVQPEAPPEPSPSATMPVASMRATTAPLATRWMIWLISVSARNRNASRSSAR